MFVQNFNSEKLVKVAINLDWVDVYNLLPPRHPLTSFNNYDFLNWKINQKQLQQDVANYGIKDSLKIEIYFRATFIESFLKDKSKFSQSGFGDKDAEKWLNIIHVQKKRIYGPNPFLELDNYLRYPGLSKTEKRNIFQQLSRITNYFFKNNQIDIKSIDYNP